MAEAEKQYLNEAISNGPILGQSRESHPMMDHRSSIVIACRRYISLS